MGLWDGFDYDSWARQPEGHRPWWQRLHIYLTGNDPWNKPPDGPPSGGGGNFDANTELAVRTAILGG